MRLFRDHVTALKALLFATCLVPLAWLTWDALHDGLGTDPVAALEHRSGDWALRLLLATLAITPLRRLTGRAELVRFRRMLGMFAFFYACVHLTIYVVIDLGAYWSQLFADVVKRPYITVGFAAWLLLIPLAVTSTRGMMRRLGRHWQRLHRLIYPAAILAVIHYYWRVKIDTTEPLIYAGIIAGLLGVRLLTAFAATTQRREEKI